MNLIERPPSPLWLFLYRRDVVEMCSHERHGGRNVWHLWFTHRRCWTRFELQRSTRACADHGVLIRRQQLRESEVRWTALNPHDGDLKPARTCPSCMGSGLDRSLRDRTVVCVQCSGSGFLNRDGYWAPAPTAPQDLPVSIHAFPDAPCIDAGASDGTKARIKSTMVGMAMTISSIAPMDDEELGRAVRYAMENVQRQVSAAVLRDRRVLDAECAEVRPTVTIEFKLKTWPAVPGLTIPDEKQR